MAGPFYNNIKGTTAGTPGTGAFTPNAASADGLAWSTVPSGWWGLVRFEDGSSWELQYSYWNGTTLSRSATAQFVSSSSGSGLTLTSTATAEMVADASELAPHIAVPFGQWLPLGATSLSAFGTVNAMTVTGTGATQSYATTNYLTEQDRVQSTSATTANAQAGNTRSDYLCSVNTTAGRGGYEFVCRFGATQIPTGNRAFIGMTGTTLVANTGEPSAFTANYAVVGKDNTDTNLQMLVNSNAGAGTKTDTGIALAANGWYELVIWTAPGSTTVNFLLVRIDTGAIFYATTSTDTPANGTSLFPQALMGLSATTGTAVIVQLGVMSIRRGAG